MPDKENYNHAKAMDLALAATALFDAKYYEGVIKAVINKNEKEFLKIAKKAEIPFEFAELLWDLINSENIGLIW